MISDSNQIEGIHEEKMMVTRTNSFPISTIEELSVCHKENQENPPLTQHRFTKCTKAQETRERKKSSSVMRNNEERKLTSVVVAWEENFQCKELKRVDSKYIKLWNTGFSITSKLSQCSYWNGLYIFLIFFVCVLFCSTLIMIPMHNQIMSHQYWWETIYTTNLSYTLSLVLTVVQECKIVFKRHFNLTFSSIIQTYIVCGMAGALTYVMIYLIWTILSGYPHPIPFVGGIGYLIFISTIIAVWFQFTSSERHLNPVRKRFKMYTLYFIWCGIVSIQYNISTMMFAKLRSNIQWVTSILLIVMRECNAWLLDNLIKKSAGGDDIDAKVAATVYITCQHSFYVAIAVGSTATNASAYILILYDFAINIMNTGKIIKRYQKIGTEQLNIEENAEIDKERKYIADKVLLLVLTEVMEIIVPSAYAITFAIGYYGPNSGVLGNIGNDCWQYEKVTDIVGFLLSLSQMFFVDLMSAVVGAILLWKFCSINILREGCKVLYFYWPLLALKFSQRMAMVRIDYSFCKTYEKY